MKTKKEIELSYDIAVVGGGMSGICAAIAAARMGAKTVLLQDRPVLGGNASSEIRMHIVGATRHGARSNLRETGIIEEILLENKYRNPEHSYGIFDTLLWEKVTYQENLDLYLNTFVNDVVVCDGRITELLAWQMTSEKRLCMKANQIIDCSGDGRISAMAGAEYMFGREGKDIFQEPNAVEKSDRITMGNTIQFRSLDAGHPVSFERPFWAYDYSNAEWAKNFNWQEITSGYWWLEIGGTQWNVVEDAELTKDEMLKIIFGIWDYIKNHWENKERAQNYYLDWISFLPAKRESRRIVGDYVLKEQDILENKYFHDAIAYGGWHLDAHRPEGFYAFVNKTSWKNDATVFFDGIYTIPYRCIYAKDFENLFLGGRIISASHRAFSSSRVMATCAVVGQAAGIAAYLACRDHLSAKANIQNIKELQQELLKQGCYLPNVKNEDDMDLARKAMITADSFVQGCEPEKVVNGIARPVLEEMNMWCSKDLEKSQSILFSWNAAQKIKEIYLTFDSDLSAEIMISLSKWHHVRQKPGMPETLVKDYHISYLCNGKIIAVEHIMDNHQRINHIQRDVICDTVKVTINKTYGCEQARLCEVRIYGCEKV